MRSWVLRVPRSRVPAERVGCQYLGRHVAARWYSWIRPRGGRDVRADRRVPAASGRAGRGRGRDADGERCRALCRRRAPARDGDDQRSGASPGTRGGSSGRCARRRRSHPTAWRCSRHAKPGSRIAADEESRARRSLDKRRIRADRPRRDAAGDTAANADHVRPKIANGSSEETLQCPEPAEQRVCDYLTRSCPAPRSRSTSATMLWQSFATTASPVSPPPWTSRSISPKGPPTPSLPSSCCPASLPSPSALWCSSMPTAARIVPPRTMTSSSSPPACGHTDRGHLPGPSGNARSGTVSNPRVCAGHFGLDG